MGLKVAMLNLVILALMAAAFLSLAATAVFLYRFMARKRLFPQLPRLWKSDRLRFVISLASFLVLSAAFVALSAMAPAPAGEKAGPEIAKPGNAPLGPSFDGQPPPPMPAKEKPAKGHGEERVLPPAGDMAKAAPQAAPQPAAPEAGPKPGAGPQPAPAAKPEPASPTAQPEPRADAQKPAPPAQAPPAAASAPEKARPAPGEVYVEEPVKQPAQPAHQAQPKQVPAQSPPEPAAPKAVRTEVPPAPAPAPKAETKPKPKAAPKAAPAPKAKAEPKAKASVRPAPKPEPAAKPKKSYTVCAASFRHKNDADREAKKLMAKGFKPKVLAVDLGQKGRWHRICLGSFPTPALAQARLKALTARGLGGTPFVTRLR